MSARDWFRAIAKEVRAIAPAWAACAAAMSAWKAPHGEFQSLLQAIGIAAYFVGAPAVGALSVGHEFSCGTWSFLLTQPVDRRRMLWTKFGVLVAALLLLGAFAMWLGTLSRVNDFGRAVLLIPLVLGAFVAPWLTLVVRRSVGGAVFAAAIPAVLVLAGQYVGIKTYGYAADADKVERVFVETGVLAACVAGVIFGWRRFVDFELVDGEARADAARSRASGGQPALTRVSPTWNLFAKEFRLQRMTLAIAALYFLAYGTAALITSPRFQPGAMIAVLTAVYGTLLAVIAGAVASAEERQLGTLDAELLLPVSVQLQWAVKAATALGLGVGLGYGIPALLFRFVPIPSAGVGPLFAGVVLLFAAASLYVSSVCRSTLAAVILAFPLFIAGALFLRTIAGPVAGTAFWWVHGEHGNYLRSADPIAISAIVTIVALLTVLVAQLALSNHRYADRSPVRIAAHAALFVVALTASLAVFGALGVS